MKSLRSLLLTMSLLLSISAASAWAATPQLVTISVPKGNGTSTGEDYMLRADGSLWSLTSASQVGTGFTALSYNRAFGYPAYALKSDGSLWSVQGGKLTAMGSGYTALSGVTLIKSDGSLWDLYQQARVGSDAGYTAIWDIGAWLHFASKADGSLWAWGSDNNGEFGDGSTTSMSASPSTAPKQVGSGYVQLWSRSGSVFGLKSDGSLWAWGANTLGQLGTGSPTWCNPSNKMLMCVATATQIGSDFSQVSVGNNFALAIKNDGTLWDWGFNDAAQLGTGNGHYSYVPQQVGSSYTAVAAAGGSVSSFGLTSDGMLWGWGSNMMGMLGIGDTSSNYVSSPRQIGSGYTALLSGNLYNVAVKADGSVWAWGMNVPRQTALVTTAPVQLLPAGSTTATSGSSATTTDCVFTWLEKSYGKYFAGSNVATRTQAPYAYRFYDGSNAILAVNSTDNHLYYAGALASGISDLGPLSAWLTAAACK